MVEEHLPSMCKVLINNWKKRREKGGREGRKKRGHKAQGRKGGREGKGMGASFSPNNNTF